MNSKREESADRTRRAIIEAARGLFARQGYSGTTIQEIARAANVSPQTIYDSVGSKAALVAGLNDYITAEAGAGEYFARLKASTDPAELIRLPVGVCRAIIERCGDILRAATAASAAEPELRAVRREGTRRHREGCRVLARKLVEIGAVEASSDVDEVTDTIATFADTALWLLWLDEYGWDLDRAEAVAVDALERLVLR